MARCVTEGPGEQGVTVIIGFFVDDTPYFFA